MKLFFLLVFFPFLLMAQTAVKPEAKFGRLWVVPEINIKSFSWEELGLERKESFTGPLAEAWKKWLTENLSGLVQEVEICVDECLSFLETWEQQTTKDLQGNINEKYAGGLWLRVSLELEKLTVQNDIDTSFQWEGRVVLLEVNSKKTVDAQVLLPEHKKWSGMDQKTHNSALASLLYRSPMGAFVRFKSTLSKVSKTESTAGLIVYGHRHLGDVLDLMALLKTRGSDLGLLPTLESFTKDQARLQVFYHGEEKSFTDLLSGLKELKSSKDYVVVNEFTGVDHVLKLVTE